MDLWAGVLSCRLFGLNDLQLAVCDAADERPPGRFADVSSGPGDAFRGLGQFLQGDPGFGGQTDTAHFGFGAAVPGDGDDLHVTVHTGFDQWITAVKRLIIR